MKHKPRAEAERLIEELLAALKAAITKVDTNAEHSATVIDQARAAIAKAEGK